MPAGIDQHTLGPGEVPGGPQRQHGQAVAGVVQAQPVLLLEGLVAVIGEGGRPQPAFLLAQAEAAGAGIRVAVEPTAQHAVVEAAFLRASLLVGAVLNLGQQLLQLHGRKLL